MQPSEIIDGDRGLDAVVVIPGIMGSELVDNHTGATLWSAGVAAAIAGRKSSAEALAALRVTDEERAGRGARVRAVRLLAGPSWLPLPGGLEPYEELTRRLRGVVPDRAAVLEFPYDWRLGVAHNATLLSRAMHRHLEQWRAHPGYAAARRTRADGAEAKLVLVAHSMGGLLVRALAAVGQLGEVRQVITMGTPFHGSIKVIELLAEGRGTPLPFPRPALRDLAATLPGLHDLLPTYHCVLDGGEILRKLTPTDVEALGGDIDLAREALDRSQALADVRLPRHTRIVGIGQETAQTVALRGGEVQAFSHGFRRHPDGELVRDGLGRPQPVRHRGDGTVYRFAARLGDSDETGIAQQHGALPYAQSVLDLVRNKISDVVELGEVLGDDNPAGLELPSMAMTGQPVALAVTGVADPARVDVTVEDTGRYDEPVDTPDVWLGDGKLRAEFTPTRPGLFRVKVGAGADPVTGLVLVVRAADAVER